MSERRIRNNKIRRRRERRRNIALFMMTFCLVISFACSAKSILSNAKSAEAPLEYKYYTSVPVYAGDTLWTLAETNMYAKEYTTDSHYASVQEYIEEICRINSLDNGEITSGMYLVIPYYSTQFLQ